MRVVRIVHCVFACIIAACSSSNGTRDASSDRTVNETGSDIAISPLDSSRPCQADVDCSDNVFCNGQERCVPMSAGANAAGCVAASPPTACPNGQSCDEAGRRCTAGCATDGDGDGHVSIACGGDDCDDADPSRFPGRPEVCAYDTGTMTRVDPTHDEDCDATTYASPSGDGDRDGDGYVDRACCNADRNGGRMCGTDCADTAAVTVGATTVQPGAVHPMQTEACNGIDDNCNGQTDEGLAVTTWRRDADGDGFGDATMPLDACGPPTGYVADGTDCNDADPAVHALQMLFADRDNDGHGTGPLMAACPGPGWSNVADDCEEGNAMVYPGASGFPQAPFDSYGTSTAPGCPPSGSAGGILMPGVCWDYNCDNVNTKEPAAVCISGSNCFSFPSTCASGPTTNTAACGSQVTRITCSCGRNCSGQTGSASGPLGCH